jgi:hypothetical protein
VDLSPRQLAARRRSRALIGLGRELTARRQAKRPLLSSPRAGKTLRPTPDNVEIYELPDAAPSGIPAIRE